MFKDDKLDMTHKEVFVSNKIIVEERENADKQHFLLFLQCLQKQSILGSLQNSGLYDKVKTFFFFHFLRQVPLLYHLPNDKFVDWSKLKD